MRGIMGGSYMCTEEKMQKQSDYDGCIRGLLNTCNCQIEDVEACAQKATPELRKLCEHLKSLLIANRETVKCLMFADENNFRPSR